MTLSFLSLAFEGLVAVLLAITIFFAIKLNRRLTLLRNREADMQRMIDRFDQAAARAEASAAHLKHVGGDTEKSLRDSIGAAKALRDDLAFMVERADVFARQLDRERAGDPRPPSPPPSAPAPRTLQPAGPVAHPASAEADDFDFDDGDLAEAEPEVGSRSERELVKALLSAQGREDGN